MKRISVPKMSSAGSCVLLATMLVCAALSAHSARPPASGGGTTTVATDPVDQTGIASGWTITRIHTPQQYPAVGYGVGFTGKLAQVGQIDSGQQYVFQTQDGWQKQLVTSADGSNSLAFAVAADGSAAMVYSAGTKGALQYAERSLSGAWTITTLETQSVSRSHGYIDVAFDSQGYPGVVYNVGSTSNQIRFVRRINGVWQAKQLVRATSAAQRVALEFDDANPVIAFLDDLSGDGKADAVRLARLSAGEWSVEQVAAGLLPRGSNPGVTQVDVSVRPGPGTSNADVVYGGVWPGYKELRFSEKVDGVWNSEVVESNTGDFYTSGSIDHDSLGQPHIAWRKADGLYHGSRVGGSWSWSFLRSASAEDFYEIGTPVVRIDDGGRPSVLYVKDENGKAVSGGYELELARRDY